MLNKPNYNLNVYSRITTTLRYFRSELLVTPALGWSLVYFFCLLTAYYVLRPVREAMASSPEITAIWPLWSIQLAEHWNISQKQLEGYNLQMLFTLTFLSMLFLQLPYGALVSRFSRRVFLPLLYIIFICFLVFFYFAFEYKITARNTLFFVWLAVFNLYAVSIFWSYMSDIFRHEQAKKLYGFIAAGGTIGAICGPLITSILVKKVGVSNLFPISIGFLAICIFCIIKLRCYALLREQESSQHISQEQAMGGSIWAGIKLVISKPLLRALALLMFLGVGVGTFLYNEQTAIAKIAFPNTDARAQFFAHIDLAINILTIVIQLLLTRWLLNRFGLIKVLLIPACIILIGFSILILSPLPLLVAIMQVITRSSEFSLSKPSRETIYTQMDVETRYKAKSVIDTVVYRGGDLSFVWLHKYISTIAPKIGFSSSNIVFFCGTFLAMGMVFFIIKLKSFVPKINENN